MNTASPLRSPNAWLPVAMSMLALAVVLAHVIVSGPSRESDEGTAAHIWQLLMAAQLPFLAFFAFTWVPRAPKRALLVIALQVGAAVAALVPVFILGL